MRPKPLIAIFVAIFVLLLSEVRGTWSVVSEPGGI